jgi:hypothetical protein
MSSLSPAAKVTTSLPSVASVAETGDASLAAVVGKVAVPKDALFFSKT